MEVSGPAVAALLLDGEELFEAIDRERRHRRLKRRQAAAELGRLGDNLVDLEDAGGRIGSDAVLRFHLVGPRLARFRDVISHQ